MPRVIVYKNNKPVDSREFDSDFFIIKRYDQDELFWETGEEQLEAVRSKKGEHTGQIHVWLQGGGLQGGDTLAFILPSWALRVDGHDCERGAYSEFTIVWQKVELSYNEYTFEFLFDKEPQPEVTLPRPLSRSPD